MRWLGLVVALTSACCTLSATAQDVSRPRPNVVFILADDLGYSDPSVYRRALDLPVEVETPRIDRLAAEGMLFLDAHQPASVCAPARFATLTGSHPLRGRPSWGMRFPSAFDAGGRNRHRTVGELMQAAGYRTAFVGKEHLGGQGLDANGETTADVSQLDFSRTREVSVTRGDGSRVMRTLGRPGGLIAHGFDHSYSLSDGASGPPYVYWRDDRFAPIDPARAPDASSIRGYGIGPLDRGNGAGRVSKLGPGDIDWDPVDAGRRLSAAAARFIDTHLDERPETPFLLFYASLAVHPSSAAPIDFDGDPSRLDQPLRGTTGSDALDKLRTLDHEVGHILDALDRRGVARDTLVFFSSDNGGLASLPGSRSSHASTETLTGKKGSPLEGGHRVPLIVRWGDGTPAGSRVRPGARSHHLVSVPDWVATLHDLSGQSLPPRQAMDSASLLPLLLSPDPDSEPPVRRHHLVAQRGLGVRYDDWRSGTRAHQWHYYEGDEESAGGVRLLFDLQSDPAQANDLLAGLPRSLELGDLRHMARQRYRALLPLTVQLGNYLRAHDAPDDLPTTPRVDYARPALRTPIPQL